MSSFFILSIAVLFFFSIYGLASFYGSELAVLLQKVNKDKQISFIIVIGIGLILGGIAPSSVIRFAGENISFSSQFSYTSEMVVFLTAIVSLILITRLFSAYYTPLLLMLIFALSGASFAVAILSVHDINNLSLVLKAEGFYIDIAFISLFSVAALVFGMVIPFIVKRLEKAQAIVSVVLTSFSVSLLSMMLFDNASVNQLGGLSFNCVSKWVVFLFFFFSY
jgi:hypothetical protein